MEQEDQKEESILNDALPDLSDSDSVYLLDLSEDFFYDRYVKRMEISKEMQVGTSFKLQVAQVSNPYKFWFIRYVNSADLRELMANLNKFYRKQSKDFKMPRGLVKPDFICATLYRGKWHRARILSQLNDDDDEDGDDLVNVYYIDYGTTGTVQLDNICFLHTKFAAYPAQALRGSLDNVQPTNGTWTYKACKAFYKLVCNRSMFAIITSINDEHQTVYMNLIDMLDGIDVFIGCKLVEEKIANFVQSSINDRSPRHYCDVYPSFDMLERGLYPSYLEITEMRRKKFDFLTFMESIIPSGMDGYSSL